MNQAKIDVEADAGRHLRLMASGAGWLEVYRRTTADWLVKRGYARWSGRTLYMTIPHYDAENNRIPSPMTGHEYYEGLCANPSVTENPRAWVDEARSQLAVVKSKRSGYSVTEESKITRACIPGVQAPHTTRTPEDMMSDMERDLAAQAKWCAALDVTPDELQELGSEGRIKMCGACGEVGIFDKPGKGERKKCRKCLGGRGRA